MALGASMICERGLGDDQHPNGYEAALDPWLRKLWLQLRAAYPLQAGLSEVLLCKADLIRTEKCTMQKREALTILVGAV